jgi:hypothetical protein
MSSQELNTLLISDSSSLNLDEILSAPCKAAVEFLKVDYSGLMLFDSNHEKGYVIAEYPLIGTKGLTILSLESPLRSEWSNFKQPSLYQTSRPTNLLALCEISFLDTTFNRC